MRRPQNPTISVLLLGVSMLLSVACSRRPSDDTIAKDIQNKVATDPATKDSQVNVVAKDGKVTLSGAVSDPTAQQKVEQIAREEPGVAGVENQTTVGSEPAMAAAPPPPEEKPQPQPIVVPAGTVILASVPILLAVPSRSPGLVADPSSNAVSLLPASHAVPAYCME